MLWQRLIFGSAMIVALVGLFSLDEQIDQIDISGTFLSQIFLGRTHLPAGLLMLGLFMVLVILAAREMQRIFLAKGVTVDWLLMSMAGLAGLLVMYAIPQGTNARDTLAITATIMFGIFMVGLFRYSWAHHRTEGAIIVASATMLAFLYLGIMPGFLIGIRRWHSAWVIAGILLTIKSCDIGAYFTGRLIGRRKLIPWLSPGKTWEGLFGGLILSGLTAGLLVWLNNRYEIAQIMLTVDGQRQSIAHHYNPYLAMLGGVLLGAVGQLGDLTASLFKRDAGFKDSGRSIPGFGGVLDVIDSPIVAAPVAYWLLASDVGALSLLLGEF
ncbi:MAG: phosphatidate cytidylyltransferase [Phycisphaeraceae bacterium]|nr:phosphatidate cytidylyltransferase [Phycisphaeraceae bacterium]